MAYLPCANCRASMEINTGANINYNKPEIKIAPCNPVTITGSTICRECGTGTGFEIHKNVLAYVSGKSSYGS